MSERKRDDASFPGEKEIEISDLPGAASEKGRRALKQKISLGPRFSARQRRRQAIITSTVICIALIVLLVSTSSVRSLIVQQFAGSATTPGVLSGDNLFYFQNLPSWGTIFVDGKALAKAPTVDSAPPTRLPAGTHRITWQAQPFKMLSCTLVIPLDAARQTCMTRATGTNEYTREATLIEFPTSPSLDLLAASQQQALIASIQGVLDQLQSSTTVQKAEYYTYNQHRSPEVATQPLQAKLRFVLDTNTATPGLCTGPSFGAACLIGKNDCRKFCTLNWPQDGVSPGPPVWHIAAVVRPTWEYTSESQAEALHASNQQVGDQYYVTFRVQWQQGRWSASFHRQGASSFDDPNCIAAIGLIMSDPGYLFIDKTQQRVTWTFSSGANRADGCLATATLHSSTMQLALSQSSDAYVLYRFGVLISANESARRLWSHLPQGDQLLQETAVSIARQPVFVS